MAKPSPTIFNQPVPRYITIAPERVFLRELAMAVRGDLSTDDPLALADVQIFLPTRRAVRALGEAFVETAPNGQASVLPRINALGDVEEDEIVVFSGTNADELALPPAISAADRRLTLARLIAQKDKIFFDGQRNWASAIAAADELGKLLDSLYTEEIEPAALESVVPDNLAEHWQSSLEFLTIIINSWPDHLAQIGLSDPTQRRIALINAQLARWENSPPQTPVIIAGSTGSTPAVARMMKAVARFPHGAVFFPGLDLDAQDYVWQEIDEPHPQSGLKDLIENKLEMTRSDVIAWPQGKTERGHLLHRRQLFSIALRPAKASDDWLAWSQDMASRRADLDHALDDVTLIEAADEESEARCIAVRLREALESATATAMLVTPDRDLARRVSAHLKRWDIDVDDSAGVPFANTPVGTFLRLTARWLSDVSDPVALLAMMDHFLFRAGMDKIALAKARTYFDKHLRGVRPAAGLEGLTSKLTGDRSLPGDAQALMEYLGSAHAIWPGAEGPFVDRFEAHLKIAELLAATPDSAGEDRLWNGDDGEVGAGLAAQYRTSADQIVEDRDADYVDIFTRLIAAASVRRHRPTHPRISIFGPLEARLQMADIAILGGLNEGIWPRDAAIDPFLSRPMRANLGLPSPERRMGLAAHDFVQLSALPSLTMTRAMRAGGKPTKPSRWLVRLKNILTGAGALSRIDKSGLYEALARALDKPADFASAKAPNPTPPVDKRPRQFYVTHIETLMRDPYAIWAKHILGLRKLDPHNEEFSVREMGTLLHDMLHTYVANGSEQERQAAEEALWAIYEQTSDAHNMPPATRAFWDGRVRRAISDFVDWDARQRARGTPKILEDEGRWAFNVGSEQYELAARADRIDLSPNGGAYIIDYKRSGNKSLDQIKANFSPQLPLTGLIAKSGGFENFNPQRIDGFEYLQILNRNDKTKTVSMTGDEAAVTIDETEKHLLDLLAHYAQKTTAYLSQPRAQYSNEYGDYDHLARRKERNARGDDGDDNGSGS